MLEVAKKLAKLPHAGAFAALGLLTLAACNKSDPGSASPVFGGQGAKLAPDEKPLPAEDETGPSNGGCGKVSPASDTVMLEDFEDNDAKLFHGFQREGWWSAGNDNTEGSSIFPQGEFKPDPLPEGELTRDNRFAAHFKASGQKQWGAHWGSDLKWATKGVRCSFNGSLFSGIRFRAKGPGNVNFTVSMPDVVPKEYGGTCSEGCYDVHSKLIYLSDHWDSYEVLWDQLQQGGWGTEVRFDPRRLIHFGFSVGPKQLPVDFWVDDLQFVQAKPPAPTAKK